MLGRNPGYVTTQGQILADLLSQDGHRVTSTSPRLNKAARFFGIVGTILWNRNRIDVLILEVYSGFYFLVADVVGQLGRLFSIPTIFVLHGGNLPGFAKRYPNWVKRVLKRAGVLVAPSPFLARGLAELGLAIRVVPNIIEVENYSFRLRDGVRPTLLWMRAFHEIYNPQMALKAFRRIRDRHKEATLVMAGVDKGLEPQIKDLANEMSLNDSVRFPGFLDDEAKAREFAKADIFLNTNRVDNMPVSVVEACAMGLPVVATNVGGIADLLTDGANGILVPDDDAVSMADAVDKLSGDAAFAKKVSANARLLAERSTWSSVRKEWNVLFEELLTGETELSKIDDPLSQFSNS